MLSSILIAGQAPDASRVNIEIHYGPPAGLILKGTRNGSCSAVLMDTQGAGFPGKAASRQRLAQRGATVAVARAVRAGIAVAAPGLRVVNGWINHNER